MVKNSVRIFEKFVKMEISDELYSLVYQTLWSGTQ